MEPQKVLLFGLGFIFLTGITLFISFKLQSTMISKKNKNIVNVLSFLFLAIASIFIFRSYSQEYIASLSNQRAHSKKSQGICLKKPYVFRRPSIIDTVFISPLFSSALFGLVMFYFFRWVLIERYSAEEAKNYAIIVAFICAVITYGTVS